MKSIAELGVIAGVALVAGLGNWLIAGRPSADPVKQVDEMPLEDGEIRLADALKGDPATVVWIDARAPKAWQKERKSGAIHVTMQSDEDLAEQLFRHQEKLFGASRVIIYCDNVNCTVSHDLKHELLRDYREIIGGDILVLKGGMTVLKDAGLTTDSSPDS